MLNFYNALRFLISCQFLDQKDIDTFNIVLPISSAYLDAFVYQKSDSAPRGTILVIHGMTVKGNRDPRIINVCKALAHCGYVVISPLYPEIEELLIKEESVYAIAETIRNLAGNNDLCPSGKISIFAASFSASMSIIASARPEAKELVNAICAIGAYSNVETSVEFLLARQDNDDYGRLIILRNFLHHSVCWSQDLSEALLVAILDNGYCRENPELPALLHTLPPSTRQEFTRLQKDPFYRLYHWNNICSQSQSVNHLMKQLSVVSRVDSLKAAVALIHGTNDRVIPSTESVILHRRLQDGKKRSRLSLTKAISHGDNKLNITMIPTIIDLIWTFAFFFKYT